MEHEFSRVIIIQIESIAAWLSYEGVCFLFNYRVAAYHDEIGSGLCVERVKGGGGKLSIITVHSTATMYHPHQGQVTSLTIDYTA